MLRNETTNKGGDKIKAYRWELLDAPGQLSTLRKTDLVVDHEYQREVAVSDAKVKRIAAEWSWVACGAIIVGDRDGVFHVIDGQHRVMAAMKRSDIHDLPCVVFKTTTQREEAVGFLRANRNRKPMSSLAAFKALVMCGNPAAVKVDELLSRTGLTASMHAGKGTIAAISTLMTYMASDDQVTYRIWPFVLAVCDDQAIHNSILKAAHYLERNLIDDTLSASVWIEKGRRLGRDRIMQSINAAHGFRGVAGEKVFAEGLANILNKGQRQRKLSTRLAS